MTYDITDKGIVYHITTEYEAEERVTDAIDDAQALEAIKREAAKIEAIGQDEQPLAD